MERLTEWIDGQAIPNTKTRKNGHKRCLNKLAHYEDLEEQGLLLKLPCKVGDTVWCIDSFNLDGTLRKPQIIREIKFNHHHLEFVDRTVFLTKAEAEKALAEMEK